MSGSAANPPSGVIVTGAPRSGTSATTRLLNLAGARLCSRADLLGGGPNNPTGHWESKTVLSINNQLLDAGGYRWWCPPTIGTALDLADSAGAAAQFRSVHPEQPWLCKDPRFAFTLPFWRQALGGAMVCVVVVRRPDEVVASLQRTWPLSTEHATALWARYLLVGLHVGRATGPTMVVRFPEVLEDPARLVAAVASCGLPLRTIEEAAVNEFVRTPRGGVAATELSDEAWELWHAVVPDGTVAAVAELAKPSEPEFVESVLGELRDELRAGRPIDVRPHFARRAAG